MTPTFRAKVVKGKLLLEDREYFDNHIRSLDGDVQVIVRKPIKQRSNQENRYYWGVVVKLLSEHTGYSDDEMHDALRMLFLKDHAEGLPTLKSTASLSTVDFEDYMSKVRQWASQELQVYVPEPNEVEV